MIATKSIKKGELVCYYPGVVISRTQGVKRWSSGDYTNEQANRMYFFREFCIDPNDKRVSTKTSLGSFINHSLSGNLQPAFSKSSDQPAITISAMRDIEPGEELLYDYGERNPQIVQANPWLKC